MEEKLIEFVKENEFLYNKKHHNYKNIYLRDKKFKQLSEKLNIPMEQLKNKWKNLRDKFLKEIKKMKTSASGDKASSPSKKWKWFDMMFLKDVDTSNERTSGNYEYLEENLTDSNSSNINTSFEWSNNSCIVGLDHDLSMHYSSSITSPNILNNISSPTPSTQTISSPTPSTSYNTPSPTPSTSRRKNNKSVDAI